VSAVIAETDININFQGILQGVNIPSPSPTPSPTPGPTPSSYVPEVYKVLRSDIDRYIRGEISNIPYTPANVGKHTNLKTYRANNGLLIHFKVHTNFIYQILPSGENITKPNHTVNTNEYYVNLPSNPSLVKRSLEQNSQSGNNSASINNVLLGAHQDLQTDSIFGCGLSPNCYCNEYAGDILSAATGISCSAIIAGVIGFEAACNLAVDPETLGFGSVICVAAGAALGYACHFAGTASIGAALQAACNSHYGHTCSQTEVYKYMCSWT
jgi:hypothetical protein